MVSNKPIKVGIFFGGQSREREISFAGGRTVYDNLNKNLFEPIPIFVDSLGNLILLNWEFLYKGTIRDFYPPAQFYTDRHYQIYIESLDEAYHADQAIASVGQKLHIDDLPNLIDIAFLALHGPYGEDGSIQGLLEWLGIPYTGSGILPSAIGISKTIQSSMLQRMHFNKPAFFTIQKSDWLQADAGTVLHDITARLGLPFVLKAPNQGSSIGVQVVRESHLLSFIEAVDRCLFIQRVEIAWWQKLHTEAKHEQIRKWLDIRESIGLPVRVFEHISEYTTCKSPRLIRTPQALLQWLDAQSADQTVLLENINSEAELLVEAFIEGKEFSCIVVQDFNGQPIALPPTQIIKQSEVFDYRAKYLPGMARKITPIDVPEPHLRNIIQRCKELFKAFHFNVYARLDGFVTHSGEVFLNDPNTTSGMLPSSFFFHQAAEIGLNPSQFLTYIIYTSLAERLKSGKMLIKCNELKQRLDESLQANRNNTAHKKRIAVIMGGYSSERHISVESGRNVYEKLASSTKYEPIPVFLTGNQHEHELYLIPINIMLKDNADDIAEKIKTAQHKHPVISQIMQEAKELTQKFAGNVLQQAQKVTYAELAQMVDGVFIALHGRPGEDGSLQAHLMQYGLPFNGSGIASSQITINKYETNKLLRAQGFHVADHLLVSKDDFIKEGEGLLRNIEQIFHYPFIAKPADDGCSSAVKKIKNREQLEAYLKLMFDIEPAKTDNFRKTLELRPAEEFPQKDTFLIETLIQKGDAQHFLEITGGMLTYYDDAGQLQYIVFEPSETLASGEVLSLEEKFLAGEGQNITPARFSPDPEIQARISAKVKTELERVARTLGVEGYCRIDAFVHIYHPDNVKLTVIEVNSLPGMTPATCIFHQAALEHLKPYEFIDKILEFGVERASKATH